MEIIMATRSSIMDTNSYRGDEKGLLDEKTQDLIERREKYMSGSYRLFYRKPVNLVRGEGEYLWDADGVKYLDMYNNVASIGHCHPAVVEAVNKQMKLLNTHTRYLHETIVDYSEKILAKMPEEVDKVLFMCTGSEANDLAIRVAQEYTGGKGIIVSQEAYHGTSALTSGVSPALGSEQPILPYARLARTPDYYRVGGTEAEFTDWYCKEIQSKIDDMEKNGIKFAGFLADSIFSSDGVHPNPRGFLKAAVDVVHKNGGVFIADEVQPGFARTGDAFWGFARHGIVPDMVTMGKPMGNGIPVSGLAARHEVLEAFSDKLPYFNTFGGNPVAMAAAEAVLKVIEEEHIQQHAKEVGAELLKALKEVQARHADCVGDVRGAGLFLGFELVSDIEKKTPDQKKALDLIELLRDNQVLTSCCGPFGNVLKIRPTLAFASHDIDWVASALDKCLTQLENA